MRTNGFFFSHTAPKVFINVNEFFLLLVERKFVISFILTIVFFLFFLTFYQTEISFYFFPEIFLEDLNSLIEDGALVLRNANYIDSKGYFFHNDDYARMVGITGGSLFLIKYRRFIQRLQLLRRARTVYPKEPGYVRSVLFHGAPYVPDYSDHTLYERQLDSYPVLPLVKNYLFLPVVTSRIGKKLIIGKKHSVQKKGNKNRYKANGLRRFSRSFDLFFTFNPGEYRNRVKDYGVGFGKLSFEDVTESFSSVLNNLFAINNRRRRIFHERFGQKDQDSYAFYYYQPSYKRPYPVLKGRKKRHYTSEPNEYIADRIWYLRLENLFTNMNQDVNPFMQREKLLRRARNRFLANRMDSIIFRVFISNFDLDMIKYWHFERKYTERLLFPTYPESQMLLMKPRSIFIRKLWASDYPYKYRTVVNGLRDYSYNNYTVPNYFLKKVRRQFLFTGDVKQPFKWVESRKVAWFFENSRWWTRAGEYYRVVWLDNPIVWPSRYTISRMNGSHSNKKLLQKDFIIDLKNDKLNFPAILRYHVQADIEDEAYMQRKTNEAVKKALMNDVDLVKKFIFMYVNLPLDSFTPPTRYDRMIPERFALKFVYSGNPITIFLFKTGKWGKMLYFTKRFYLHKNEFVMPMRRNFDLNAGRNAIAQLEIAKGTYNRVSPVADYEYMIRKAAVGWLPRLSDHLKRHSDIITKHASAPYDLTMVNFAMVRGYKPQDFANIFRVRRLYYEPFLLLEKYPINFVDLYHNAARLRVGYLLKGEYFIRFLRLFHPEELKQGLILSRYYHAYFQARPSKLVGSKVGPYSPIYERYKPADYSYPRAAAAYENYRDDIISSDYSNYNNNAERVLVTNQKYWESFDDTFVKSFSVLVPVKSYKNTNDSDILFKTMDGFNDSIFGSEEGHFMYKQMKFSELYFQTFKKTDTFRKEFRKNVYLDMAHKYSLAMYDYLTLVKRIAPYRFYKDKEDDLEPNFYLFDRDSRFDPDIELYTSQAPEFFDYVEFSRPRVVHPMFVKSRKKWVDYYLKKKSIIKGFKHDSGIRAKELVASKLKDEESMQAAFWRDRERDRAIMIASKNYPIEYIDIIFKDPPFDPYLGKIRHAFVEAAKLPPTTKQLEDYIVNRELKRLLKQGEYEQEYPDSLTGIRFPIEISRLNFGFNPGLTSMVRNYPMLYGWVRRMARNNKGYNPSILETEQYRFLTNYYRKDYLYNNQRRPYTFAWGVRPFRGAVGFSDFNKGSDFLWNIHDTFDTEGFMGGGHDIFNYEVLINRNRSDMSNIKAQGFYNMYTHHDDRHPELNIHDDYNSVLMDQSFLPSYYNETLYVADEETPTAPDLMFNQGKRSVDYINMMYDTNEDDPSRSSFWETFFTRYKYKPKNFYFPYSKVGEFRKYFVNLEPSAGSFIFIHRFDVLNNILFNFYRIYQFFGTNQKLQQNFKSFKVNFDFLFTNNFFPITVFVYPIVFFFELISSMLKLFFLAIIKYLIIFFKFWLLLMTKFTNLIFGVYLFEGVRLGGLYLFLYKIPLVFVDRLSMFHERFTFFQLEQLFQYTAYLKANLFVYVDSQIFESLSGFFINFIFYRELKQGLALFVVGYLLVFFVSHFDEVFRGANIEAADRDSEFYAIVYMLIGINCVLFIYWGYYNY